HQRLASGNPSQQLAQGAKRLASQREWVQCLGPRRTRIEDRINLQHYRKDASERHGIPRHQRLGPTQMQRSQMLAQTVDDSIESFIRNRPAFITTSLESEHLRSFESKLTQEPETQWQLAST